MTLSEYQTLQELIDDVGLMVGSPDYLMYGTERSEELPDVEVTIEITDMCIFNCPFCSTNSKPYPTGNIITLPEVVTFLSYIRSKFNIIQLNVSGGEPLLNPEIGHILIQSTEFVIGANIWLYTNLIKNLIFNSYVRPEFGEIHANVPLGAGLDVHVPEKVNYIHFLKLVPHGRAKDWEQIPMKVSGNFEVSEHTCETCNHILLQADGKIVDAPCKKEYDE
jgi:hypothetical protein